MNQKEISVKVKIFQYDELSDADRRLVDCAKEMTRASLASYSGFHVGAAILMANGEIIGGSNQENAAYPSGLCAERTAAFYASSRYPGVAMKKIAIAAWTKTGRPDNLDSEAYFQELPISPCGGCRQSLLEYETLYGPIEVLLYGRKEIHQLPSIASLLPLAFTEF